MSDSILNALYEACSSQFIHRALLAGFFVSIISGLVGTIIVAKRMSSVSGGLSHAAFGGLGLGLALGFSPTTGAVLFCVGAAILVGFLYLRENQQLETLIAMMWSVGMAVGIICVHSTPGGSSSMTSFLFGNILLVSTEYLWLSFTLVVTMLTLALLLKKELVAIIHDEEFAKISGLPFESLFIGILIGVALSSVALIQVVGTVLSLALLTIPTLTAIHWAKSLTQVVVYASVFCMLAITAGILGCYIISAHLAVELPVGAATVILCAGFYLGSLALRMFRTE